MLEVGVDDVVRRNLQEKENACLQVRFMLLEKMIL
jgi:hypothetical protein